MSLVVSLDTAPLSILTNPRYPAATQKAPRWSADLLSAGHRIVVPALADFELRRELIRRGRSNSIASLDAFNASDPSRYLPLSDTALKRAAELWARARNLGTLPADPRELNVDILIAAQMLEYCTTSGIPVTDVVVATVNVGHLSLFVRADLWTNIKRQV